MRFLELSPVLDDPNMRFWVGGRTAFSIARAEEKHPGERAVQARVGLHLLSFRVRHRKDVDRGFALMQKLNAKIVHLPSEWPSHSGYYSFELEDADGIHLEICHARGKGAIDETMTIPIPRPRSA